MPSSAALYLKPDGTALDVGTVFRNPDLASTYERIAHLGLKGFYRGAVADAIVNTVQAPPVTTTATPGWWHPGVMTMRDLHDYVAPERAPTHVTYHGADVYSMGPPSSGGRPWARRSTSSSPTTSARCRATRRCTLPRGVALRVRRPQPVPRRPRLRERAPQGPPVEGLRGDAARAHQGDGRDEPRRPGRPLALQRRRGSASVNVSTSEGEPGQTTHLSVVDRNGNAVSYTFTIEQIGGAGMVVPGFGFLVNNELTDFNYDSTGTANQVEGGKRPRSSMSPTIVLKDGKPFLVMGSPGARRSSQRFCRCSSTGSTSG